MNYHKGFIAPLFLALIAILLIGGGVYVFIQTKPTSQEVTENPTPAQTTPPTQTSNSQMADWKTYTNTQYSFTFKYPSYLGDIVVTSSSPLCPLGKTYMRSGVIQGTKVVLSFSEKPKIGIGAELCRMDMLTLANNLATNSVYSSRAFQQKNSIEAYKSTIGTVLGTSADVFYTLFPNTGANITIIQPRATFMPYANSDEWTEIDQKETAGDRMAIVTFINGSQEQSAKKVRQYLVDFEQIVQSIKFIPPTQPSPPIDNYSSQYPDPSTYP
jgi:hypothetical protein